MLRARSAMVWSIVPVALALGCSGDDSEGDGNGTPAESSCVTETRAESYSEGMAKAGGNGINVELTSADPAPPAIHDNVWTLTVTDANGDPVDGADLTVIPFMPDHQHETNRLSVVKPEGDGRYLVDPVNFMMAGYWEVTVEVASAEGGMMDKVVFKFCIPR